MPACRFRRRRRASPAGARQAGKPCRGAGRAPHAASLLSSLQKFLKFFRALGTVCSAAVLRSDGSMTESVDMFSEYDPEGPAGGAADPRTALGVAGALRKMRLYSREFGDRGLVVVEPREFWRWARIQTR
jgi:hypothetical protein